MEGQLVKSQSTAAPGEGPGWRIDTALQTPQVALMLAFVPQAQSGENPVADVAFHTKRRRALVGTVIHAARDAWDVTDAVD